MGNEVKTWLKDIEQAILEINSFIIVATTGVRAVKAALANPVDSLRDE
jgi:hypothetical protein